VFGGHLIDGVVQNLMELYLYPGADRIERIPHGSWFFMDI
jgi:predicted DNA-binding protein with PD1-like motif